MANVEIFKLKKTVDPAVREYGMFEFFGMVDGPLPQNYVREWAGELNSGNLETLCGRFMLNPPDGYHSGPLEKSDIVVVNGEAYFLDRESGYKFVEMDFDTSNIKDAVHVSYGYYVSTDGAMTISSNLAGICRDLDIPIGYFREPDYHGSHKGASSFEPSPSDSYATAYLHPHFLKGEEAREFINLLTELSGAEQWTEIVAYLGENYPVCHRDLEKARELYAPELLLPAELRPLSKVIPAGADKADISCLAEKVKSMNGHYRNIIFAVVEAGRQCGSVSELIELTNNLDRFDLQPALSTEMYGAFQLEMAKDYTAEVFQKLEQSENPVERELAQYILRLEAVVEDAAFGRAIAEEENGVFTQYGYLSERGESREINRGMEDIPGEHSADSLPLTQENTAVEVQAIPSGIKSDEMLGRYLYDNKMLSTDELQSANARLSITAYPVDCYRMIGRRRREMKNGTYTQSGYVEKCQPSVLERIAADRAERAVTPDKPTNAKTKSHGLEL